MIKNNNEAYMVYDLMNNDLDFILSLGNSLKLAKDSLQQKYHDSIECKVQLIDSKESPINNGFRVSIESKSSLEMNEALKTFFSSSNPRYLPSFIEDGSNYDLIEKALNFYNKTLKRKFRGHSVGKHVIECER